MTPASDINVEGFHCVALFTKIYKILNGPASQYQSDISPTNVQDELGRFKLWGRNIGAFQKRNESSSLEYRLQDASETRQHVLSLLQDLRESLEQSTLFHSFLKGCG
jgi:hypothetical protein